MMEGGKETKVRHRPWHIKIVCEGNRLPVVGGLQCRQFIEIPFHDVGDSHQHTGTALGRQS